jgi:hypothetical protein
MREGIGFLLYSVVMAMLFFKLGTALCEHRKKKQWTPTNKRKKGWIS